MKVILLLDITKLGKRGDIKEVADSYAINVLIPKKQALRATPSELAKWESQKKSKEHKKEIVTNVFLQLLDRLKKESLVIRDKKHDSKGQLFAQVKDVDIAHVIFEVTSLSISPKQISISTPIKNIGKHFFEIRQDAHKERIELTVE